jgi:MazG family protein
MTQDNFEDFVQIMARLRGEGGCPWDREQTYDTLKNYLIEETYEAVEAIEEKDYPGLCEELGDVLLEVVFLAQIAREEDRFTIDDVIDAVRNKMVRRHPHVFGDKQVADSREVLKNWEEMKQAERAERQSAEAEKAQPPSILDGVTRRIPAVLEASQLSQRAARVGFDWSRAEEILEKLNEELEELQEAMKGSPHPESREVGEPRVLSRIEDEIGDIIFVAVNLARHFKIDPESALKKTNQKFRDRFRYIENKLARGNKSFEQTNLQEMESYWQEAKRGEPNTK